MGIWTGIKHAINSTLGTADFKPLDKLFLEQKAIVASDMPFYTIVAGERTFSVSTSGSNILPYKIKMINSGSLRVSVMLRRSISDTSSFLRILVNDIERKELSSGFNDGSTYLLKTADIKFKQDDVISFGVGGYKKAFVKDLTLCGTIVDNSLFKDITE